VSYENERLGAYIERLSKTKPAPDQGEPAIDQ